MKLTTVESSMMYAVGYDRQTRTLLIDVPVLWGEGALGGVALLRR